MCRCPWNNINVVEFIVGLCPVQSDVNILTLKLLRFYFSDCWKGYNFLCDACVQVYDIIQLNNNYYHVLWIKIHMSSCNYFKLLIC